MKLIRHIIIAAAIILSGSTFIRAQEKISPSVEMDKVVHNFGEIIHKSGAVSCTFTLKNTGNKPLVIYNVITSCGCTDVEWTREPIKAGQSGKISVTYSNDEGAYPFDKTLTTYVSEVKNPILLKIRGTSVESPKPLKESYPISFGPFALKEGTIKCGNLEQGGQQSDAVLVANTSKKPIEISFKDVDKNLSIKVSPNPIPAESYAEMTFTVTADRSVWGKNTYYATPLVNGKSYVSSEGKSRIGIWAFTKENFSHMTQDQMMKGSRPSFEQSTFSFGKIKRGEEIHASFTMKNVGQECFCVYRVNTDAKKWSHSTIPTASPGEEITFRVHVDTSDLPAGEHLTIVTLTTNSPLRPIVNLFIAGFIE